LRGAAGILDAFWTINPGQAKQDTVSFSKQVMAAMSKNILPAGTQVAGYRLVGVLRRGSIATTYDAFQLESGRRCAIKEFFPLGMASRKYRTMVTYRWPYRDVLVKALRHFQQTAEALSLIEHPNIVSLFDCINENDTCYMVMEYIDGQTFDAWLIQRSLDLTKPLLPELEELHPFIDPYSARLRIFINGALFIATFDLTTS
jgi:serine/threonine protein kinase